MSLYRCPKCGTGRFHATGCSEVPITERDRMYDEANRQPALVYETNEAIRAAKRAIAWVNRKGST